MCIRRVNHREINNTTGSSNIALGSGAGANLTTGSNNIDIGTLGAGGESNTTRIGAAQTRTFIKGINGVAVSGTAVVVNSAGQLGVTASSARFKDEIKPMEATQGRVQRTVSAIMLDFEQNKKPPRA